MVTCKEQTEHYSSGRALLEAYDLDLNKWISKEETVNAILVYLADSTLSQDEITFIIHCYEDYGGDINAMCPKPAIDWWFWILIATIIIIIYMLGSKQ